MNTSVNRDFWRGKRVFLTGHTGFKGAWACMVLEKLGAKVFGFALPSTDDQNLYSICNIGDQLDGETLSDIRSPDSVRKAIAEADPEVVLHMAAQALVKDSYHDPVTTYETNIMGTVHLFEALRQRAKPCAVVNVTSDKCYENREWVWPYRETDPMGGHDPYSSSKGCAELVTRAYSASFLAAAGIQTASARAGNVIGGGDWSANRLIPDLARAVVSGGPIVIRSPEALRPWQHVLEPVGGYLILAQALLEQGAAFAGGWNFGPSNQSVLSVARITEAFLKMIGSDMQPIIKPESFHEATILKLDSSKASSQLDWQPRWEVQKGLEMTARWYLEHQRGADLRAETQSQITAYLEGN